MTDLTLTEIAKQIDKYLKRFEADPVINERKYYTDRKGVQQSGGTPFYHAMASRAGNRVRVSYVSYQGSTNMTRAEALEYLAWLDAGNVGSHYTKWHKDHEVTA